MAVRDRLTSLVSRISKTVRPKSALKTRTGAATTTFVTKPLKSATKATKVGTAAKTTKATKAGRPVGKRQRIDTTPSKAGGSRYVRRDAAGQFTEDQVSVGKSLAADRRTNAKTKATKGNKDRGD